MSFTESDVESLARGELVHEDDSHKQFAITLVKPAKSNHHWEAWAYDGRMMVVRITCNSVPGFHHAKGCTHAARSGSKAVGRTGSWGRARRAATTASATPRRAPGRAAAAARRPKRKAA